MTPLQLIARIKRLMDEMNIPIEGRGLVFPEKFLERLFYELSFLNKDTDFTIGTFKDLKVLGFTIDKPKTTNN